MNASATDLVAEVPAPAGLDHDFVYRPDTGLAYYAAFGVAGSFQAINMNTFLPVAAVPSNIFPNVGGLSERLISVGPAGLAQVLSLDISGTTTPNVYIFPLSRFEPLPPLPIPSPPSTEGGIQRFPLSSIAMASDPAGAHLYFSIPAIQPLGNSIVPFDVATGQFGNLVWVGSDPGPSAVSGDGQHLFVFLYGPRSLLRLSLPDLILERESMSTRTNTTF